MDEKLFEAVWVRDAAKVSKLLRRGANPNAKDEYGSTPLHDAALKGHADIASLKGHAGRGTTSPRAFPSLHQLGLKFPMAHSRAAKCLNRRGEKEL